MLNPWLACEARPRGCWQSGHVAWPVSARPSRGCGISAASGLISVRDGAISLKVWYVPWDLEQSFPSMVLTPRFIPTAPWFSAWTGRRSRVFTVMLTNWRSATREIVA